MTRDAILQTLRRAGPSLKKFGVKRLAVFGSAAREEMRDGSDVDILVEFDAEARVGLFEFTRLRRHLSQLIGLDVDLVTLDAVRPEMRDKILREKVDAA